MTDSDNQNNQDNGITQEDSPAEEKTDFSIDEDVKEDTAAADPEKTEESSAEEEGDFNPDEAGEQDAGEDSGEKSSEEGEKAGAGEATDEESSEEGQGAGEATDEETEQGATDNSDEESTGEEEKTGAGEAKDEEAEQGDGEDSDEESPKEGEESESGEGTSEEAEQDAGDETGEESAAEEEGGEEESQEDDSDDPGGEDEEYGDSSAAAAGASDSGDQDEKTWLYVTTPVDESTRKFHLVEIEGSEQISGLFHYRLTLRSTDNTVDFSQILGQNITVTIEQQEDVKRYINGVVFRFIQAGYDGKITTYFAEIRPWFWRLSLASNSRIFQDQTALEIITKLFGEYGFSDYKDSTTKTYAKRTYCVQYQETVFDFISRIMESEGIFYFFQHEDGVHTMVLADDKDAHETCPGLESPTVRQVFQGQAGPEGLIDRCSFEQQVIPNKYGINDYNFLTPTTDLGSSVDGQESGDFGMIEYPGNFEDKDAGEALANLRMESLELPQKVLNGEGFCRTFGAGYKFTLAGHEREDMNASYVLKGLSIWATQDQYRNSFQAFPEDTPYRPPMLTAKPRIFGTQTAVVVGKSGEEIWTDEHGRIKVQFHWDQEGSSDENSSCWVRVAQFWAGKGWGALFVPRIGTEVVVSFLEGNPDRPLVVGMVYNANQTPPETLPDDKNVSTIKTISTKEGTAGNEIRFDDTKDAEELSLHAQKDFKRVVENDETVEVTKNRSVTVKEEKDSLTVSKGDREVDVTAGNETHTNGGNFTHNVSGNFELTVDGNVTIKANGEVVIKGSMVKIN